MEIKKFVSGLLETNSYLIIDEKNKKAALIDPAKGSKDKILSFLEKNDLSLEAILITHSHFDHIGDVRSLQEKTKACVYIHKEDEKNLEKPGADGIAPFEEIEGAKADKNVKENDLIEIGDLKIEVIHTPGHTPGGVCYYLEKEKILFSGDTLFSGTIGNLSFPTCSEKDMWISLKKLSSLPVDTIVYPGHGEKTSIGKEKWLSSAEEYFS